jgi:hypothetical protein
MEMRQSGSLSLIDCGVAPADFETARARFAALTSPRRTGTRIAIFDGRQGPDLAALLGGAENGFVDVSCLPAASMPLLPHALVLRLSTLTALKSDAATAFAVAAAARFPDLAGLIDRVSMALQEAIGNAVMHGNLDLKTAQRGNLEGLVEFAAEMERRLADPSYAARPVTVGIVRRSVGPVLWVDDCGRGFTPPEPRGILLSAGGGNGLAMIRACTRAIAFSRGGRRISMRFGQEC